MISDLDGTPLLLSGAMILRCQMDILASRITALSAVYLSNRQPYLVGQALWLDTETYYTVAHDLLKLGAMLLPSDEAKSLKAERAYKIVAGVRSHLVRHAYDKPDGDPWPGFGIEEDGGVFLRRGSSRPKFEDPGFEVNACEITSVFDKYGFPGGAFMTTSRRRVLTTTASAYAQLLADADPNTAYELTAEELREWDHLNRDV